MLAQLIINPIWKGNCNAVNISLTEGFPHMHMVAMYTRPELGTSHSTEDNIVEYYCPRV